MLRALGPARVSSFDRQNTTDQTAMKMPRDIELNRNAPAQGWVQFRTRCGRVSGSAHCAAGEYETHYDVVEAKRLTGASVGGEAVACSMSQREVGCFDILGQVRFIFEDGVFTVESCGFDFWVEPDQIDSPVQLGDWVRLYIQKLTLYV